MDLKARWSLDSLVLIFGLVIAAQMLTYVVPQGAFERVPYEKNPARQVVVADSYHQLLPSEEVQLAPWHFLLAIPTGLEKAQDIVFLVFLVGGVIALLRETGAIDAGLHTAVAKLKSQPWILVGGTLLLFSLGSFTIGMGEEYVPLIPILVTMSLAMKMDAIVAMGMVWIPYGIGWACAGTNPFGVLIAQDIANVPITSGWPARLGMMLIFLVVAFHHIYRYARRVKREPSSSLVADIDYREGFEPPDDIRFTPTRALVLVVFFGGIAVFVAGAARYGWYIKELNAVFLGTGVIAALIARMSPSHASRTFVQGAAGMTAAALLIGFARAIEVVLVDGRIIDTIVETVAGPLRDAGPEIASVGMLAVQTLCNLFIPSGSGQAFVTMPIMTPLAALTGVSPQTAVLAYQFGDGFTNMVNPTSALVMGTLALGRIPYGAWVRFAGPLLVKLFGVAIVFLVLSVHFGAAVGLD